jgi:hypothetical protein
MLNNDGQQASRKRPVPEKLARYIDLANIIPPPDYVERSFGGRALQEWWRVEMQDVRDMVDKFPGFKEYLESENLSGNKMSWGAKILCDQLRAARAVLYAIAHTDKETWANEESLMVSRILRDYDHDLILLRVDERGNLRLDFPLLRAIEGVEASRIRECAICRAIFWAGRVDQRCCKTQCAHVLRTRKWRERYPDKYKPQRIFKAESSDKSAPTKRAAQEERERQRLESMKAPSFSHRSPRLPNPSK